MDIGSLYMLLNGMGGMGGMGGQQPQQPQQMPPGRMGRMTGGGLGFGGQAMDPAFMNSPVFSASAYRDVPVSHTGTPMDPSMVGNQGMPILNASAAPQQGQQGQRGQHGLQGQNGQMAQSMMLGNGLNMLFDALRGS